MSMQIIDTEFDAPDDVFGPATGSDDLSVPNDIELIQPKHQVEVEASAEQPSHDVVDAPELYLKPSRTLIRDHTYMVKEITMKKQMFPDELSYLPNPSQLRKMSLEDLEDMSYDIDINVDAKFNVDAIMSTGMTGVALLEVVGPMVALKTSGLSKACEKSPEFQSALRRVAAKYAKAVCVSPEYGLGIALVNAVREQHKLNCDIEKRSERVAANLPIPNGVQEAGRGL
jgi:hypothetical protein